MTRLLDLFDGRRDCHFDSYDAGAGRPGLVWDQTDWDWRNHFGNHAEQDHDIGVYPRRDDGTCKWGCIDIDSGDFSEALATWDGLREAGVSSWIEKSGSWKDLSKAGYHVWVFAQGWVDATVMRPLLVEVARHAGLPDNVEINPKQVTSTAKGVGNCVRLPYGRRSVEHPGYSCMVFSPGGEFKDFTVQEFLDEVEPVSTDILTALGNAALMRQQMRKATERALEGLRRHEQHVPPFGGSERTGGRSQRAWKILNGLDRAADGERNQCAFVIACHLTGLGIPLPEAESRMTIAVQRSFDGGADFLDEALAVLRRVHREKS